MLNLIYLFYYGVFPFGIVKTKGSNANTRTHIYIFLTVNIGKHRANARNYFNIKTVIGMCNELFIKFRRAVLHENRVDLPYDATEALRNLRGEVFSNLARRWTVKDMAKRTGLSLSAKALIAEICCSLSFLFSKNVSIKIKLHLHVF